ncbi:MAG TPA: EVE domain-containing protein [Cyclobacteriaceae bacterium]|jgi:predicted RNA-binding protein with PUA-like domain|nr:EVE domain-containing protein [Cytophagales bacterium]HNT51172.1 EVE domain-containing protein [Cyclobacteriaceae bacterium]HRE65912.1 EVE domain-containing protein [Cyclobacteriaceae bacterium]HRF34449.1 EVE domain-containing protein [Cyclobacteriaceae bacterium]
MNYWLLKTEPGTFSWSDLERDKKAVWDGVRNFQARSNMKAMKKGDWAFIYHTGEEKSVVGIAEVTREFYPEPKAPDWVAVDLKPVKKLKLPVALSTIKADKLLASMVLVKVARLSVQPVRKEEFDRILERSEK